MQIVLVAVLGRKLTRKGNWAVIVGLTQWSNLFPEDAIS